MKYSRHFSWSVCDIVACGKFDWVGESVGKRRVPTEVCSQPRVFIPRPLPPFLSRNHIREEEGCTMRKLVSLLGAFQISSMGHGSGDLMYMSSSLA